MTIINSDAGRQSNDRDKSVQEESTCWDTGCTYPVASLAVMKELKAEIMPLTQDLIIVEASGSELKILGTAVIYMQAEVLGDDRKKLEVAIIEGQEGSKEILVSLKLMKAGNVVHQSFPRESVTCSIQRNKLDKNYTSYYSVQVNESMPLDPPSKSCKLLKDKIMQNWKFFLKKH